jgi:uncharacterized RDD family membrane protein YckC
MKRASGQGLRGHCAGFASRFVAYAVDLGTITGVFMLSLGAADYAARVLTGHTINWSRGSPFIGVAYAIWWFLYFAYSWAANGKTLGMALLGVRVVREDGTRAEASRGVLRAVVFPLSFLLLGLGFIGILLGRERRALHDVLAGTAVVYTWEARAARLRFLSRDSPVAPAGS